MPKDYDLDSILGGVKLGKKSPFRKLEDELWSEIPFWIPTGAISLDYAIGGYRPGIKGGIPFGRCIEIVGPEQSAKSSLLDNVIKHFIDHHDGIVLLCDREHSHEEDRLTEIGIDSTNLRFIEKEKEDENETDICLEEFFESATAAFREIRKHEKEAPILVALDSLAVTPTRRQQQAVIGEKESFQDMNMNIRMDKSAIMSSMFPEFCSLITKNYATLIIINQLRQKPGVSFGSPEYSPGGETLKYLASLIIRVAKGEEIKGDQDPIYTHRHDDPVGIKVKFKITKNKIAPPFRTGTFPLFFDDRGIYHPLCLTDALIDRKTWEYSEKFEKSGAWYSYNDERVGQGVKGLCRTIASDEAMAMELERECYGTGEENEEE